jgi:23S rRNA (uracil1939-C5)-methyltransferase
MDKKKSYFKTPAIKKTSAKNSLVDQQIEVSISQLAGLGEGAGEYEGRRVFVPCTTGGDVVKARIIKDNEQFLRGELVEVITPSQDRVAAVCKWFNRCGGCTLQHISKESYRAFKTGMLTEAVRKAGYDPSLCEPVHFLPAASRRRVELKVQVPDGQGEIGFYKLNSHELVAIDGCPIMTPKMDACISPLREWIRALAKASMVQAIRISEIDEQLDLVIELKERTTIPAAMLEELKQRLELKRVTVCLRDKSVLQTTGAPIIKTMGHAFVPIPIDVFLQASEEGERWLVGKVTSALANSAKIADLFCGIGTYSFPLSNRSTVTAFELDDAMVRVVSSAQATIQKAKPAKDSSQKKEPKVSAVARNLYSNPITAAELGAFDALVINPPRDGAKSQCEHIAHSLVNKVVMVSCNPATFTRDAAILQKAGFSLTRASGLDQFVFSPYLEIVAVFER